MEPGPQPLILRRWKNHLPHDAVLNILTRLPVKSLLRFRCVCKLWDSSITSPNFISTHLNIVNNNDDDDDHAYLIQTCIQYNAFKIPMICKVLCCDRTFDSLFEYSVPSVFALNMSEMVGSCNGLVCLAQRGKLSTTGDAIYLWNPSVRKFKRLPDSCSNGQDFWFSIGFGYQSKTNDYKVVKLWGTPVVAEVYTLCSDSWRKVEISLRSKVVVSGIEPSSSPLFFSGALHWIAYHSEGEVEFQDPTMILSFDVDNEKFGEMALPAGDKLSEHSLFVFKGNVAFISCGYAENDDDLQSDSQCFIWVMRDYGVDESWNKLLSIRFENADIIFYGCTEHGELLLDKKVKEESKYGEIKIDESMILSDDTAIVSLDPETLHEKDLGILRYVTRIVTTFKESLVLLDGATGLSG
ncbi:F-box/kelch-repeat protein At3g06240-like isoform X1 [Quercus robur]|uniref:F-box/kelch-repeat protein At3g06240-like isoform X1 n=1 Tax=Quercus robur TaxID=38942 RepID=UPI002163D154|nr:F-box/kelch-repeat protein At3g06240-like isoform X1 [Quercus robur]